MLMDHSLIFAENQALTAAAAGKNVVDLEQDSTAGFSKQLVFTAVVQKDVTGKLQVKLQDCDTASGTFSDVAVAATLDSPKAGTVVQVPMPYATKRYLKAYFGGSPTAGTVAAFLTEGRQQWRAEAQAPTVASATVTEQSSS